MRFLLIDQITAWEPGKSGTATKNVALSEDLFDDHFPMKPIMPGVLICESVFQSGCAMVSRQMAATKEFKLNPGERMEMFKKAGALAQRAEQDYVGVAGVGDAQYSMTSNWPPLCRSRYSKTALKRFMSRNSNRRWMSRAKKESIHSR